MRTYAELSYMEEIKETNIKSNRICYLPHHAVVKKTDPEGKVWVVFNASFRAKDEFLLNDVLLPGLSCKAIFGSCWHVGECFALHFLPILWRCSGRFKCIRRMQTFREFYGVRIFRMRYENTVFWQLRMVPLQHHTWQFALCYNWLVMRNADSHEMHCESTHMWMIGGDNLEDALDIKAQTKPMLLAGGFQLSK